MNKFSLFSQSNNLLVCLLIFMGVVNYLLTSVNPLRFDDVLFQYFCTNDIPDGQEFMFDHNHKIENLREVVESVYNHTMILTGRAMNIFFVQCFCSIINKPIFDAMNAVFYILFLYGCIRLIKAGNLTDSVIVIGILWFALPVQQIFTMSIAFAINYLWPATIFVYYLILLRNCMQKRYASKLSFVPIFLYAIITGYTHELFTAPLSAALFIYTIRNYKNMNKCTWLAIVGLWIGTTLIMAAPATWNRASNILVSDNLKDDSIIYKLHFIIYSKRFFILILFICVSFFLLGKERMRLFLKKYTYILQTIVFALITLSFIPHYSQRMSFPIELLSVLVGLSLFFIYNIKERYKKILSTLLLAFMLIHIPITIYYSHKVVDEYHAMIKEYLDSEEGKTHYQDFKLPKFVSPYVERLRLPFEAETLSFNYGKEMIIEE